MATRLSKILWSVLCGTALGLGGCYDSDPPEDASTDTVDAVDMSDTVADTEPEVMPAYGVPEYGPPWP